MVTSLQGGVRGDQRHQGQWLRRLRPQLGTRRLWNHPPVQLLDPGRNRGRWYPGTRNVKLHNCCYFHCMPRGRLKSKCRAAQNYSLRPSGSIRSPRESLNTEALEIKCDNLGPAGIPRDLPGKRDLHQLEPLAAVRRALQDPRAGRQLQTAGVVNDPAGGGGRAHFRVP